MMRIRVAAESDAAAIAGILREAFGPFEELYTTGAYAATVLSERKVRARFREKGRIWVAEDNGRTVGTVSVVEEEGRRLYIRSMAVAPSAQRGGIGRGLLREIEEFAREEGFEKLFLYTTPFLHGAIRLYEKNGFGRGAEEVGGFYGTPLLAMEKDLT